MKSTLCLSLAALAGALGGCATTASEDDFDLNRLLAGESALQGAQLERALAEAARHPLGSMENPVRASMPAGERAYLGRLRCPDGAAPRFERQGSGGDSPYGNIIDFYQVQCADAAPVRVIMDMYHAGYVETRPVPGFTIVAP